MMTTPTSLMTATIAVALAACATMPAEDKGSASLTAAATEPQTQSTTPSPAPTEPAAPPTSAPARPGCPSHFAGFDTNADERVSRDEFLAHPHARPDADKIFSAIDADGDGVLTSTELCSGEPHGGHRMSAGPGMGPGDCPGMAAGAMGSARGPGMGMGPARGPGGSGPGMQHGPHCESHFARFDANSDGTVTKAEFAALPHPHADPEHVFAARDQDHDGRLTKAEFCAPRTEPTTPAQPASP